MSRLSLKTVARASGIAVSLVIAGLLVGCDLDSYPQDLSYGLRTDPIYPDSLVKDLNKNQPKHIDLPGVFPNILADLKSPEVTAKALNPVDVPEDGRRNLLQELTKLFGTPAQPTIEGISPDLRQALVKAWSGDDPMEPARLQLGSQIYRQQCLHCHGLTGNGRGPTAPWVNPHPRDFRLGRFKFTSSSQDEGDRKPRREDLLRTFRYGIEASAMPAFGIFPDEQLEALASYILHLSMRGEIEANVIQDILNKEITGDSSEVSDRVNAYLTKIVGNWAGAEAKAIVPGPYPLTPDMPKEKAAEVKARSVKHGLSLFKSTGEAGCIGCHLDFGRQNNFTYDVWGTITKPINLTLGTYRGGRRPLDLYYRIHSGINGTGMTAFGKALKSEDIWDIVNFLQVLPYKGMRQEYGIVIE
jgi:mono/diheme cytochrome c family protein